MCGVCVLSTYEVYVLCIVMKVWCGVCECDVGVPVSGIFVVYLSGRVLNMCSVCVLYV